MTLLSPNVITVSVTSVSPEGFGQESHCKRVGGDLFLFGGGTPGPRATQQCLAVFLGLSPHLRRIFAGLGTVCRAGQRGGRPLSLFQGVTVSGKSVEAHLTRSVPGLGTCASTQGGLGRRGLGTSSWLEVCLPRIQRGLQSAMPGSSVAGPWGTWAPCSISLLLPAGTPEAAGFPRRKRGALVCGRIFPNSWLCD